MITHVRHNLVIAQLSILIVLLAGWLGCQSQKPVTETRRDPAPLEQLRPTARTNFLKARLGPLDPVPIPPDNPLTEQKVTLGKTLFFDPRLGGDQKTSCASCHQPEKAWADGRARAVGVRNRRAMRNTPTLLNVAYYETFYWDGRASSLEDQVLKALANPDEMASSPAAAVKTISAIDGYKPLFEAAFGDSQVTAERIAQAIASFERTLVTGPSPFDKFIKGDLDAMTGEQKEGLNLFLTRAECFTCHQGKFFTNQEFTPSGIYVQPDMGRYNWTKQQYDYGKFRVPSLRNAALTPPYFHNGSEPNLVEAAFFRIHGQTRDQLKKRGDVVYELSKRFSDEEIKYMAAFMQALTGELPKVDVPQTLPQ